MFTIVHVIGLINAVSGEKRKAVEEWRMSTRHSSTHTYSLLYTNGKNNRTDTAFSDFLNYQFERN